MGDCGNGLADGRKGPLGDNLHLKAMRGVLLEKGVGRVAHEVDGRSIGWSLVFHNIS